MTRADEVSRFWFDGDLQTQKDVWYQADVGFDTDCGRFRAARDAAKSGALGHRMDTADALDPEGARHAHSHREVIRRFGRFSHRNAALGRTSTKAELALMAEPGSALPRYAQR